MPINIAEDLPSATGRSLAPVAKPDVAESGIGHAPYAPPSAGFLAQLVATAQGAPQTRARRRESMGHATALYAAAARNSRPGAVKVSM